MKKKHKQMLLIAGCAVACIVLVAVIGSRFGTPPETTSTVAESSTETEGVTVAMEPNPEIQETSTERATEETPEETKEIVIQTESAKPAETRAVPVQTDQKAQAIQPSPEKPTAPPEEVLSDPTQKPDGEKVEGTPVAEEHEAVVPPSEPPAQAGEPQPGDTKDGQIYIPGFGWVENHGGGGSGSVVEDMYENGNKIGIMD